MKGLGGGDKYMYGSVILVRMYMYVCWCDVYNAFMVWSSAGMVWSSAGMVWSCAGMVWSCAGRLSVVNVFK